MRHSGLTLFELLAALALTLLVTGLGVPALNAVVADARQTATVNDLVAAIQIARTTAIRRSRQVVICPAGDVPCAGDAHWNHGWIIFVNEDGRRPPQLDPGEPVIHRRGPPRRLQLASNRGYFAFHRIGLRSTNGTITLCDNRGSNRARAVIISYTGRPRVARRHADGRPLTC